MKPDKIKLLVGILSLIVLLLLVIKIYPVSVEETEISTPDVGLAEEPSQDSDLPDGALLVPNQEAGGGELVRTETIVCNNERYILGVTLNKYYFSDIYKDVQTSENLLVRIRSSGTGSPIGSPLTILSVPEKDCDRVFLTRLHPELGQHRYSIFEWKVGSPTVRELTTGEEFSQSLPDDYNWNKIVSPDGERVLSVIASGKPTPREKRWTCDYRTLLLFHLRKDTSEILVRLPDTEAFDSGFSEAGTCDGVNTGWLDESTIYYNVYDVTTEGSPLLERRTLKIER